MRDVWWELPEWAQTSIAVPLIIFGVLLCIVIVGWPIAWIVSVLPWPEGMIRN